MKQLLISLLIFLSTGLTVLITYNSYKLKAIAVDINTQSENCFELDNDMDNSFYSLFIQTYNPADLINNKPCYAILNCTKYKQVSLSAPFLPPQV